MATPQWKTILESYEAQIAEGKLGPGERIPAEEEIAKIWSVSRQTVHKAVQELQRRGLVVRKRRWGTVVAPPKTPVTGRIALLVDLFAQAYGFPPPDLIKGIQDAVGEDVQVIVAESKHDPDREIRQLRRIQTETDGVLLWPVDDPKTVPVLQGIVNSGFPVVVLDRMPPGLRTDSVMSDHHGSSLRAMRELAARGHRRIGFFSFNKPELSSVLERHDAYVQAIREAGAETDESCERWFFRDAEEDPEQFMQTVADAVYALTHREDPITALFCVQDSIAVAAYRACDRHGIRIPDDLEMATFNDWPPMLLRSPWNMHRIVQRHYDIGFRGATILKARIADPSAALFTERVPADLFLSEAIPVTTAASFDSNPYVSNEGNIHA